MSRVSVWIAASTALSFTAAALPAMAQSELGSIGPLAQARGGYSPVATTQEIDRYVRNGSVYAEWYDFGTLVALECGYFSGNGIYESISFDTFPDGTYYPDEWFEHYGQWWVNGNSLCYDIGAGVECYIAEWSTVDTLLLIDGYDSVAAELITYDGPGEYYDECFL